ncbi:LysR family transcriptional regulator [Mameliella sediminis]|uniref:LysR family transcriptional regulator n=1 Tax=Mameliella sediminis TaxID=2836866 RepID=UPI001C4690CC|nr:LysR family transcriptional regulator [Mameliella sediminis]MBV7396289.1 LysR family transcriptional regulator [Mameliella sediminis]MBY6160699.1 LysR family transcriptional regulator [Mameliella alba]MBY6169169.1 LysR family transcriptional regulator [Mameliella alba]MBY6173610.1 LysR family transcriptional regulator [Mameliella alba]
MNWSNLPPLSALRAFCAYAETRSVNAAGAALNVSHAAISQQMRALEAHMGVALLDRRGRKLELTAEGETLARCLIEGFGTIALTVEALTGADASRPLQISVTPTFAAAWLMPRLPGFREIHPDINLMIDPSARVQPMEPGGFDMALRYGDGQWPGLDSELLIRSPIVVVAAPDLVGDRPVTSPADLRDYHWLQELGTNEATEWFAQHGVDRDAGRGYTALPGNHMLEAARAGQGVAIVAGVFVEPDIQAGRLRKLFEDKLEKGYHIVTRPGVPRPPLKAFLTWLRREAAKT